jgi:6-pyruvoyltetrahydropterin/6-carboxytetrahydropterin synthase
MLVTKAFTFDAAHALTKYYGKCENMHGHMYRLEVTVDGPIQDNGMVLDFVLLNRIVKREVISKLDHTTLNSLFDNPSAELIAIWIWEQLNDMAPLLSKELEDPNLGKDLTHFLSDLKGLKIGKNDFKGVRLHQVRLFESPNSFVTYRGE